MIRLDAVRKSYGPKWAVDGLSLDVPSGEFFALLGPNGAGKTTTIKMIVGLLRPSEGRILVEGLDLDRDPLAARRLLGYVPDQPFLYDKLSGREFMRFLADMYHMPPGEARAEIARLAELFELQTFIDDLADTYSHGMKQRLVLASTLLHKPKVLVVDEPLVGLDPPSGRLVKRVLKEETRRGTTVFMSTHVLSVAEEVGDRIGIMVGGKIVALGTVAELNARFHNTGSLEDLFMTVMNAAAPGTAGNNGGPAAPSGPPPAAPVPPPEAPR